MLYIPRLYIHGCIRLRRKLRNSKFLKRKWYTWDLKLLRRTTYFGQSVLWWPYLFSHDIEQTCIHDWSMCLSYKDKAAVDRHRVYMCFWNKVQVKQSTHIDWLETLWAMLSVIITALLLCKLYPVSRVCFLL